VASPLAETAADEQAQTPPTEDDEAES
jgi:hypothetical protein